ncbi:MAG: threonine dehydratase [Chloroflexota bacterium]|nr:threonine dehydratase [Chloroflexota bacterium]
MSDGSSGHPQRDVALETIRAAAARIEGRVHRTPMLSSHSAARQIEATSGIRIGDAPGWPGAARGRPGDARPALYLKAEHLQVTGSFKPRGAVNRVERLTPEERSRGLITLSAGNHAQAVAYAAGSAGIPVTVVMPVGASRAKAEAAAAYGAEVVLYGEHVGDTFQRMEELRDEHGLVFVHPFDDPDIIAGQGTVGLEIVEDLPHVDVVVVGVGGGGLIGGISAAVRQLRRDVRVIGVEPERSNALTLGLGAGEPVSLSPVSIADGLGAPFAGRWTIDLARRYVDSVVLVDEVTIARGLRFALERMKQLLEPAGAAALGAVLAGRIDLRDGETVAVVASGGNVDLGRLSEILELAAA